MQQNHLYQVICYSNFVAYCAQMLTLFVLLVRHSGVFFDSNSYSFSPLFMGKVVIITAWSGTFVL